MLDILITRWRQGFRTMDYPDAPPVMPDRLRGLPVLTRENCRPECEACFGICPNGAIRRDAQGLLIDLGRCLFCGECQRACPHGAVTFGIDHRLAVRRREDLIYRGGELPLAAPLDEPLRSLFGGSFKLRQVSASGCNACEADINVLGTLGFDLGRFGIQVVASPRHADAIIVTGPVSKNMRLGLEKTFFAIPTPRLVIAVGACAISGGPFLDHPEVHNGAGGLVPVDLFIPGCPPHPITILDGLLRLLGRL